MSVNMCTPERTQEIANELDAAIVYAKAKLDAASQPGDFVIVICGAFSTGKTSLINALLGCTLPTGINPVTKTITKLRYGIEERFIVYVPENGEEYEISKETALAIAASNIKEERYGEAQLIMEMPSSFLKGGIIVVDTPGFEDEEKEKLDELSRKEIREADFCIVNFSCNRFGTMNERAFLRELQDMTNGNFICILNCMNYLMQAGQAQDLKKRAANILPEFGNPRIGMGRYFMVDSSDGDSRDLNGLDEWLASLLENDAWAIQADTSLAMALSEIRRVTVYSDEYIRNIFELAALLRNKNDIIIQEKRKEKHKGQTEVWQKLNEQKLIWQDVLETGMQEAMAQAKQVKAEDFQSKVRTYVVQQVWALARQIDGWLKEEGLDVSWTMQRRIVEIVRKFSVPEPSYELRERGLLDIERYLIGRYYRVYNDYHLAAKEAVQKNLIPKLKGQMKELIEEISSRQGEDSDAPILGGYEIEISRISDMAELLSAKSLDAKEMQQKIRLRREELLQ